MTRVELDDARVDKDPSQSGPHDELVPRTSTGGSILPCTTTGGAPLPRTATGGQPPRTPTGSHPGRTAGHPAPPRPPTRLWRALGAPRAPLAVPIEVAARIAAVIAVGYPVGDLATARDDLERLGRALVAAFRRITGP